MESRFETFTVLITKISRNIRRIKNEEMAEFELKSPHVSCIYYLYKRGRLTSKELCDMCEEDKAAISRTIDYLQKNGYVKEDVTMQKRYRRPLVLTEKGLATGKKISEKIDGVLNLSGTGLTEEELSKFYEGLKRISDNLEKICEEYEK